MNEIADSEIEGIEVVLDGKKIERCVFRNCTIVFEASAPRHLKSVTFDNCRFTFRGAAADTVQFMKYLYGTGDAGRAIVLDTFKQIAPDVKLMH